MTDFCELPKYNDYVIKRPDFDDDFYYETFYALVEIEAVEKLNDIITIVEVFWSLFEAQQELKYLESVKTLFHRYYWIQPVQIKNYYKTEDKFIEKEIDIKKPLETGIFNLILLFTTIIMVFIVIGIITLGIK